MLLSLDALNHPRTVSPYRNYNIPNIDPASWVADIGIASVWLWHHANHGKPHGGAPEDIRISNPPTTQDIDKYYEASAPEEDLLADVDSFGLYEDSFKDYKDGEGPKLSTALRRYYLGSKSQEKGQKKRWTTFCRLNGFVVSVGNDLKWIVDEQKVSQLIRRINNFCNLYGAGDVSGVRTIMFDYRDSRKWPYTRTMLFKFLKWVRENLAKERGKFI